MTNLNSKSKLNNTSNVIINFNNTNKLNVIDSYQKQIEEFYTYYQYSNFKCSKITLVWWNITYKISLVIEVSVVSQTTSNIVIWIGTIGSEEA